MSSKSSKRCQEFKENYTKQWSCITASKRGIHYAYCSICNTDVSVKHSGSYDIKEHIKTTRHTSLAEQCQKTKLISDFLSPPTLNFQVINAECLFSEFVVEHNLPISIADHATLLFPKMFPDSKIAKEYACKRTKTTRCKYISRRVSE